MKDKFHTVFKKQKDQTGNEKARDKRNIIKSTKTKQFILTKQI